jgi:metal-responsive CopG/Arc/MetJ family transcriptional regulator
MLLRRVMAKPPSQTVDRIVAPMRRELVERIDDFRFARRIPSRAEAIRRLIEAGLEAAERIPPERKRRS